MRRMHRTTGVGLLALLCAWPLISTTAAAQTAPPIHGVNGTLATDGTIDDEHAAAHAIAKGAGHVIHSAKELFSFGGKGTDQNPLAAFAEGRRVVVRDVAEGARETEGVVIDVNRPRKQITIRFADGKTQTLRFADRTAAALDAASRVVVSYRDQAGATVAYDFKRVS